MRAALAFLAVLVLPVAGCGNEPTAAPVVTTPQPAEGWVAYDAPEQGVSFERPASWRLTQGSPPLLATLSSGQVTISVWRYPRNEALPETLEELTVAKDALVAAAQARDPSFRVIKAKGTRAAGRPAVVIIADETVAGQPRRVRSTHIYDASSEVVIDAFAPADQYAEVEEPIIIEMVRSFVITEPQG